MDLLEQMKLDLKRKVRIPDRLRQTATDIFQPLQDDIGKALEIYARPITSRRY